VKFYVVTQQLMGSKQGAFMKTKLNSVIFSLFLIAVTAVIPAFAQSASDFTVDANGVITKYTGFDTDIVIPAVIAGKRITAIGNEAFQGAELTSIIIPEGITSIGVSAFRRNKLTSITVPGTVKTIESGAFRENPALADIVLSEGVVTIGANAFSGTNCKSISIPSSVTNMGNQSFDTGRRPSFILAANIGADFSESSYRPIFNNYIANDRQAGTYTFDMKCDRKSTDEYEYYETQFGVVLTYSYNFSATRVRVPSEFDGITVKALHSTYYNKGSIVAVQIPDSITYIGSRAFINNQLTSVTIPASVTFIGDNAFENNQLTSVVIPASVLSIGNRAFYNNKLTSVTIPANVLFIGNGAFSSDKNDNLKTITIPQNVKILGGSPIRMEEGNSILVGANVQIIFVAATGRAVNAPENLSAVSFAEAYNRNGGGRYTANRDQSWSYTQR
jgi:hypothetical protein